MRSDRHPGDRLRSILVRAYGLPIRDFSHEQVDRSMAALNKVRMGPKIVAEVLALSAPVAFTLPGNAVYLSRRLIERCRSDAPVAFALGHEIAHHDLGHLAHVQRWLDRVGSFAPATFTVMVAQSLLQRLYSVENERAADAYALRLCLRAGFDGEACLEIFDLLAAYLLDHRDLDGVYGTDDELDLDPDLANNPVSRLYLETRLWVGRHARSHPSIHERRDALQQQLHRR